MDLFFFLVFSEDGAGVAGVLGVAGFFWVVCFFFGVAVIVAGAAVAVILLLLLLLPVFLLLLLLLLLGPWFVFEEGMYLDFFPLV